jgi:hypothetical protein
MQRLVIYLFLLASPAISQTPSGTANRAVPAQAATTNEELPKRLLGIIPNYRSHASLKDSKPLTAGQKFHIAVRDSFDPGNFVLVGALAGIAQASNSSPSYGQGFEGYGKYYGSTFGEITVGNFMTTGVYPSLFHQDPRYFRRGSGSVWSRLTYAMGQVFVTHGDNKRTQFNFSELCGNATAVAISNAWNPDNRTASDAAGKLGVQLGLDMAGNVMKEFVPDLFSKKKHAGSHSH